MKVKSGYISIFFFALVISACTNREKKRNQQKLVRQVDSLSNAAFIANTQDSTIATAEILDKYLPVIMEMKKADTSLFYYGDSLIEDDDARRLILIGNFIDRKKIIATEVDVKDTVIKFYYLEKGVWKLTGTEKTNIPVYKIEFQDLDGDNKNEILTSTSYNMNGNSWYEVYYCSGDSDSVTYSGSFSTDYKVNKIKKQIEETYEGSWYMDYSQTLYQWQKNKLIPVKEIVLAHDKPVSEDSKIWIEYYYNPTNEPDGLKLKYKEHKPYSEDDKKQKALWDHFFDE